MSDIKAALKTLELWTERDITAACAAATLPRAVGVDATLQRIEDVLAAGRHPVVVGESGVGKTAVVIEMAYRALAGEGPARLHERRIVQLSFARRAAALKRHDQLRPEADRLIEALKQLSAEVIPYFRDIEMAYENDLEPLLYALSIAFDGVILGEGNRRRVETMLEYTRGLEDRFALVHVEEPNLATVREILAGYRQHRLTSNGQYLTDAALDEAVSLANRFIVRDRQPRKTLDLLEQIAPGAKRLHRRDCTTAFCRKYRLPQVMIDPEVALSEADVAQWLGARLFGQDEALQAVVNLTLRIKARLTDERRPLGALLLTGPSGVGKTYLAQLTAERVFGDASRLTRLNMADYQGHGADETLFGDPLGHGLKAQRGELCQRIWGRPMSVLLLDEFDKADGRVHDRFLQLIDEGCFINGADETVVCRSMIILATSNVGAELQTSGALGFSTPSDIRTWQAEMQCRLLRQFRPELLNRFDDVICFRALTEPMVRDIVCRELASLAAHPGLGISALELEFDDSAVERICELVHEKGLASGGVRFVRRATQRHASSALAALIAPGNARGGDRLRLTVRGGELTAVLVRKGEGGQGGFASEAPAFAPVSSAVRATA